MQGNFYLKKNIIGKKEKVKSIDIVKNKLVVIAKKKITPSKNIVVILLLMFQDL